MIEDRRKAMEEILRAGLDAVDPERAVRRYVRREDETLFVGKDSYSLDRYRRVILAGAGKGTAPMAKALEDILGDRLSSGWIIVKYGYGLPLQRTSVVEAGHPIPDEASSGNVRRRTWSSAPFQEAEAPFCRPRSLRLPLTRSKRAPGSSWNAVRP
jgi:glycerate-2-kinase